MTSHSYGGVIMANIQITNGIDGVLVITNLGLNQVVGGVHSTDKNALQEFLDEHNSYIEEYTQSRNSQSFSSYLVTKEVIPNSAKDVRKFIACWEEKGVTIL